MDKWTAAERECLYMEAKDFGFSVYGDKQSQVGLSEVIRKHLRETALGEKLGAGHVGDIADRAAARVIEVRRG